MTFFRLAVLALLVALSSNIQAADGDTEKLAKLMATNAELTRKVAELTKAKADCDHVLNQMMRATKDD